jgi:hypothetical protein
MDALESRAKLLNRLAVALELLEEIIDDPAATPRERLKAVSALKAGLCCLAQIAQSPHAPPDLRDGVIEILRQRRNAMLHKHSRPARPRLDACVAKRPSEPPLKMSDTQSLFGDKQIFDSLLASRLADGNWGLGTANAVDLR